MRATSPSPTWCLACRRVARAATLAASLALAGAALAQDAKTKAFDAAILLRELESAASLAGGLKVAAEPRALREGEAMVLSVELRQPGYLNVISVNPAGEPTVLFPNQFQSDNHVEAGRFSFPTAQMAFELRASAPHGESHIAVFQTSEPLNLYLNGEGERNAAGALLSRFASLSLAGRDLINIFSTRSLQSSSKKPLAAGITTVNVCAASGPCEAAAPAASGIRQIVDAIVPGIFRDKDVDLPEMKAIALRPVSEPGIRLTKASEGFVPRLYHDATGYCTIAYGHLMRLGPCESPQRRRYPGSIAEPDGDRLLVDDLALAQRAVMAYVKVPLSEGQYASLVDFTFNVGAGNLKRSTLLKAVNAGQHERVPFQFMRWTRAGGRELRGLKTRREREVALFFGSLPIPKVLPAGEDLGPIDILSGEATQ